MRESSGRRASLAPRRRQRALRVDRTQLPAAAGSRRAIARGPGRIEEREGVDGTEVERGPCAGSPRQSELRRIPGSVSFARARVIGFGVEAHGRFWPGPGGTRPQRPARPSLVAALLTDTLF